jgi:hypothetical protein
MKTERKQDKRASGTKRPYVKPQVRAIKLAADEMLAVGCKTSPISFGFGSNLCTSGFCSSVLGS